MFEKQEEVSYTSVVVLILLSVRFGLVGSVCGSSFLNLNDHLVKTLT